MDGEIVIPCEPNHSDGKMKSIFWGILMKTSYYSKATGVCFVERAEQEEHRVESTVGSATVERRVKYLWVKRAKDIRRELRHPSGE
jgi:hypothetical protein